MGKYEVTLNGRTFEIEASTPEAAAEAAAVAVKRPAPKAKTSTGSDMAQSGVAGLKQGVRGVAASFNALIPRAGEMAAEAVSGGSRAVGNVLARAGAPGAGNLLRSSGEALAGQIDGSTDYRPQTVAGEYSRTVGQMVPNAMAPGSLPVRALNVLAPAFGSEAAGQAARPYGAGAEGGARLAGGLAGGVAASARINPRAPRRAPRPPRDRNLDTVARRQDPAAMAERAAEYRNAGVNPTLTDVVDDSGRGVVRAAASRMTPGRQKATDFRDGRAQDLPARVSAQARRVMSDDPRTPDQIRTEMAAQRGDNADAAFGAVRGEAMEMAPETVQALRNPLGREAIAEAARRERDPQVRAALGRLATDALDAPSTPITVGMADRISRTLFGRAQAAARAGDNDLAETFSQLAEAVRGPARNASAGYRGALEGYAADSRLVQAADVGENLLVRNTDEFVAGAAGLGDDERALALAAGRRAIERAAGENPSAAPGVARKLSTAPEQQARNAALMGPERAQALEQGMRMEERAVRNANDIAPRTGPQSQNRAQDAADVIGGVARTAVQAVRRDFIGIGLDWLRSRGMNDAQAQQIVEIATDPAQVDRVITYIQQRFGPRAAQEFLTLRSEALIVPAATLTAGAASADEGGEWPEAAVMQDATGAYYDASGRIIR